MNPEANENHIVRTIGKGVRKDTAIDDKVSCGNCGRDHGPEKKDCPAVRQSVGNAKREIISLLFVGRRRDQRAKMTQEKNSIRLLRKEMPIIIKEPPSVGFRPK